MTKVYFRYEESPWQGAKQWKEMSALVKKYGSGEPVWPNGKALGG